MSAIDPGSTGTVAGTSASRNATLILGSVGVVYGDIGTSPIYALREGLHAAGRGGLDGQEVIGVVSLLLWTLVLIVTIKYVILILRADNRGEGGTLSLLALAERVIGARPGWLLAIGIIGAGLFFGDAIITPAISVLSAVEGLKLLQPALGGYVTQIALAILFVLFWVQSSGTGRVSSLFGPVMLVWFLTLGGLGLLHIRDDPAILSAFNPVHAASFLGTQGAGALPVMAAVFLAVTGAEALYADMGHFGRRPIRIAWTGLVLPSLALAYLGQGALVLSQPDAASDPFFRMVPSWGLLPLILLATAATVIASQAVITGAFSMAHQAVQLGLLPRLRSIHTSGTEIGQIYLPRVNWMLAAGVMMLVIVFESSSNLASAYGIAVTGDMIITSILAAIVFRLKWRWPLVLVGAVIAPMLGTELMFLAANLTKIFDGGYLTIGVAAFLGLVMWTWTRGTALVREKSRGSGMPLDTLCASLSRSDRVIRVPGTAVFLTGDADFAPSALLHNLKHNAVLHERNIILSIRIATRPRVPDDERVRITPLTDDFTRLDLTFGYLEPPNVPRALGLAKKAGLHFEVMQTSFFLHRRVFQEAIHPSMPRWQEKLFLALTRGAGGARSHYRLPSARVLELGQQVTV